MHTIKIKDPLGLGLITRAALPGALIGVAQGLAMPHAQAAAINAEPDMTGTASGIVMFLHFSAAAISSLFISTLYDRTFFPLIEVVFVLSILALGFGLAANAFNQRKKAAAAYA